MGGAYEVTGGAVRKYYAFAGQIIAMKDGAGLKYLLTDHLGSVVAVTGSNGTLTSQQRYLPFGGIRTDLPSPDYRITSTDFGYTRQRKLDEGMGGLMDYKARFYSPTLGRFIQPDTIIPGVANPQSWNRYSYVLNRPIVFNDPTGHDAYSTCAGNSYCMNYYNQGNNKDKIDVFVKRKKDKGGGGGDKPGCGIDGKGAYGFHCTKDDIDGANLQQRLKWFKWLTNNMNENIRPDASDWFINIKTVLAGFVATGQDDNEWVLNVDANILLAIQDGYVASLGIDNGVKLGGSSGASLWLDFFVSLQNQARTGITDDALIGKWGDAEQAGTNEGLQGTQAGAGWDDQAFTLIGNVYRGAGGSGCQTSTCVGGFFDPRSTSLFDVQLGFSPVALAQLPIYFFDTFGYAFTGH